MEVLSSVSRGMLDVLDGALDDATDPPLTPEPRIKLDVGHIPSINWDPFAKLSYGLASLYSQNIIKCHNNETMHPSKARDSR